MLAAHDGRRYPGGKNHEGLCLWLLDRQPLHTVYIEPCVGSGALIRRKTPALKTIAIDANPAVAEWWQHQEWPGVDVVCADGVQWCKANADRMDEDVFIYWDPPYLLTTRSPKRLYGRHEMTRQQHVELLAIARDLPSRVAISGYPSALYEKALSDWTVHQTEAITRGGVMRTECLWMNYEPAELAPPFRPYIGDDFRERERIKRQTGRWCRRLVRLPPHERRAILLSMLDASRRADDDGATLSDPTLKRVIVETLDAEGPLDERDLWRCVSATYARAGVELNPRQWRLALADLKAEATVGTMAGANLVGLLIARIKPPPPEIDRQRLLF